MIQTGQDLKRIKRIWNKKFLQNYNKPSLAQAWNHWRIASDWGRPGRHQAGQFNFETEITSKSGEKYQFSFISKTKAYHHQNAITGLKVNYTPRQLWDWTKATKKSPILTDLHAQFSHICNVPQTKTRKMSIFFPKKISLPTWKSYFRIKQYWLQHV